MNRRAWNLASCHSLMKQIQILSHSYFASLTQLSNYWKSVTFREFIHRLIAESLLQITNMSIVSIIY